MNTTKKKKIENTTQAVLAQAFEFTGADLLANRDGAISNAQKQRIEAQHTDDAQWAWIAVFAVTGLALFGSGLAALTEGLPIFEMWTWVMGLLCIFGLWVWAAILRNRTRMRRTLQAGGCQRVRGKLILVMEKQKTSTYYLVIGGQQFRISALIYNQMNAAQLNGREAFVYYTAPWHSILSISLVEADKAKRAGEPRHAKRKPTTPRF